MDLPNNNEDVLVELENNIFSIAQYYDSYWENAVIKKLSSK